MAEVQPLETLRYEPGAVGSLGQVIAPPYDVIDEAQRSELAARSPFNVVEIDLPRTNGGDPYMHARDTLQAWLQQGVLVREREPAIWILDQDYAAPEEGRLRRRGFFARVRVEEYGDGRIRPHERTHPGPMEDRLRLTVATRANLSPIFSLFPDPGEAAAEALDEATEGDPFATATDDEDTWNVLWRVSDPQVITALQDALAGSELLIADGHHRYETARAYANEVGGEGPHRYVLMFLCSLSDPGLTVLPTHRLVRGLKEDEGKQRAIRQALTGDFEVAEVGRDELAPQDPSGPVQFGYMDSFHRTPYRLTLRDQGIADRALAGKPHAYRRLDTAVLEGLVLRGALGMSEDDIAQLRGLGYSKDLDEAARAVESGDWDAGFFMRATPIEQVRQVAAAGESMPPKSTYFHPKVPTGLVFNLLE